MKKEGGFDYIPDGTYNFTLLNRTHLHMDAKVNDARQLDLHRNNGITVAGFDRIMKENGSPFYDTKFIPDSGMLAILHWITQAFIQ